MITVGEEFITAKRDLSNIFPAELVNRKLFNQYIQYVLNNFFEKSKEKMVVAFVGNVVESVDGTETYVQEPTVERQINQIIPVLKAGDKKITFGNYISNLHNEGCTSYDQNKLVASKYWSWCPPINVDMFVNFVNYYWIGYPVDEGDIKAFYKAFYVKDDIIGKETYTYKEYDDEGAEIMSYDLQNGDVVVFPNDLNTTYNCAPFKVSGVGQSIKLKMLSVPLIIVAKETNITTDIIGQKNHTITDEDRGLVIPLMNGMRIRFLNDANEENNNISYMVNGVGEAIELVEDSFNPYDNLDDMYARDYFLMERGSIDGNDWSKLNRWVQREAISLLNIETLTSGSSDRQLHAAEYPIICFNKDIELYNYGSFGRGDVKYAIDDLTANNISGTSLSTWQNSKYKFNTGDNILLLAQTSTNTVQLYTVRIVDNTVYLDSLKNNKNKEADTIFGDTVRVTDGDYKGKTYYYNGYNWVQGQVKETLNQKPLFNLYDVDGSVLNNTVNYPNSTFYGCTLFQYKDNGSTVTYNKDLNTSVVTAEDDSTDYFFDCTIVSDEYYYTPENDYQKKIAGYHLYKNIKDDSYLNNWHLSNKSADQYLKTRVEVLDNQEKSCYHYLDKVTLEEYPVQDDETYQDYLDRMEKLIALKTAIRVYELKLKYTPLDTTDRKVLIITNNDSEMSSNDIIRITGKQYYLKNVKDGDVLIIKLLTDEISEDIDPDYVYDYPLSLTVNQFNKDIDVISYSKCFNQLVDIISFQPELVGSPVGSNNYSSIVPDISLGTKIIQTSTSVIRSMILGDDEDTSIRASVDYSRNAYTKFKEKFMNLISQEIIKGNIIDNTDVYADYEANPQEMDGIITSIIAKINIGKEGLMPFYNNGVTFIMDNAYIPATPAFLGAANCVEPRIEDWTGYTLDVKPSVVVGHDGSLTSASYSVKDLLLLRLEQLIYQSIESKFKDTRCGLNIYPYMPGKFRKTGYTRQEVLNVYAPLFEKWCDDQFITYEANSKFVYDSLTENPSCWKTWNYTSCLDKDEEVMHGSYRAMYIYYYDTYRPDTHPWEMLGFGDKPSWWETYYGEAPYTSENMVMWTDIENGIIRDGDWAGEHAELKRPGLVEKYLPVDEYGNLKNPVDAGILNSIPTVQTARRKWVIGDIGDVEFAYLQTSEAKYNAELVKYMLRPVEWVETNWDNLSKEVLFRGTKYEQVIDSTTDAREDLKNVVMHNELVDGKYVRKIGIQQWISDYLTSNTVSITDIADNIRTADICLGYRCSGFYQDGTVRVITDTFGELPEENVHINLLDSKREGVYTYSGMTITKSEDGYVIDGFDINYPYFKVRMPIKTGKKSTITVNDKVFYYYHEYEERVTKVPYRKEYTNMQDVYDLIIAYGRYLTENENWYFNVSAPNGTVLDFRVSAESFANWATSLKGKDTLNALLLINPGAVGLGNYNDGMVTNLDSKIGGYSTAKDIYGHPLDEHAVDVYRQSFDTYFQPKDDSQFGLVKFKTYDLEHLITFDNKTIYEDVLYDPIYSGQLERFKLFGVKVLNWYGNLYAPGYIVREYGAIPNYDKTVNDLQYIFDVNDVHCQGKLAEYSRGIVGYRRTKTYQDLYKNDTSMFDFYKGAIRHKGTRSVLEKMNRSTNISSTGNNIELYEQWAFREGKFGHIKDNSVDEFILDTSKMIQNPQVITFETAVNYYYDPSKTYNYGDVCVYNNYEYIAITNGIHGVFDELSWKKNRYVGNYIIFTEDPNWIKKSNTLKVNCFKYTDNLLMNPIGGFAKTDECAYIVGTEAEALELLPSMEIGDTVWIVKLDNDDWDVRKKTGVNKLVSMRYFNIKDAVNQDDEVFVYHFKDDKIDYYATKDSEDIEIKDIIYSDIDIDNITCKWGDIGIPAYTGETGTYVTGTDYKVKLYNTVFKTMSKESELNNGTPFVEIYDDGTHNKALVSYSNLLMNMVQFGTTKYKYRWVFSLTVETDAPDVKITINGNTYKNPTSNRVEMVVSEGDIIEWKASAYCCGERKGTLKVEYVDGENYKSQKLKLTVPLSYRKDSVIYNANAARAKEPITFMKGNYEVSMVGAGGGAGGGCTCHRKHHKCGGCTGGGGAYLHGILSITDDNKSVKNVRDYSIITGRAGTGGGAGHHLGGLGNNGGDSAILLNDSSIIYAQSGAGGRPGYIKGWYYPNGPMQGSRKCGYGGVLQSDEVLAQYGFTKDSQSRHGNHGCMGYREGYVAASVYPVGNYGRGGNWVYKGTGQAGYDGLGKVVYKGCANYDEYGENTITKTDVRYCSREKGATDSMEYSSYYQPYILPYTLDSSGNGIKYFFSYDVLYDDGFRPNASEVSPSSKFYRYRSKAVTAYHADDVIKNIWVDFSNVEYNVGDTVTVKDNQIDAYVVGSTAFASNWLSLQQNGSPLTPEEGKVYYIKGPSGSSYVGKYYKWRVNDAKASESKYTEVSNGNTYTYYKCEHPNTASGHFSTTTTISGQTVVLWKKYAPTYYYKITYNLETPKYNSWQANKHYNVNDKVTYESIDYKCTSEHDSTTTFDSSKWSIIISPLDPRYDNGAYELYEDAQCTVRAEKDSFTVGDEEDYYMNCSDLNLNINWNVGSEYTLVDELGTFKQLSPTYMNEPSWNDINQVGTYAVSSGGIEYYCNSDIATIKADENSYVYSDIKCTTPVKSVYSYIVTSSGQDTVKYTELAQAADMKYVDIINTISDHTEISYEMKDKDLYLYTNKTEDILTLDTPVYKEFGLINQLGVYEDYIPTWEQTQYLPNEYTNTIKFVKYEETDVTAYESVKVYSTKVKKSSSGAPFELFYKDGSDYVRPFYAPNECNASGKVVLDEQLASELYTLNDYTANTYNDMISMTGVSANKICRVANDENMKLTNSYYKRVGSSWNFIGTFDNLSVWTPETEGYYKRYQGNVYLNTEENTSKLYPELSYKESSIDNTNTINKNGIRNTIQMYYNKQSVGKNVLNESLVYDKSETEEIQLFNTNYINDPMYKALLWVATQYDGSQDMLELFREYNRTNYAGQIYYLNEVEAMNILDSLDTISTSSVNVYFDTHRILTHTCEKYGMSRNIDGEKEYTPLFLYGDKFYARRYVVDIVSGDVIKSGIYVGTMSVLTTYNRTDYEYSTSKSYNIGDLCEKDGIGYECIKNTSGEFDELCWEPYTKDKIVNVISYKESDDIIYITSDEYKNRVVDGVPVLTDETGSSRAPGSYSSLGKKGWLKMKYIDEDYEFSLISCERKRLNVETVKSCYLVDNSNDNTIVQVQVFDPIQNIIPNNILNEINYISSTDPVGDYLDSGKWSNNKIGFLWWDTSKVRYVDYYQGDYEYRRDNWGKQLPGSEIAIMEWTKSITKPDDGIKYIERSTFNYETSTIETYYYYWKKNPIAIPDVPFRSTSAYHIAEMINDPTKEGIIWMSPIDTDVSGRNDNTLILTNYSNVMLGQEAVLQLNTDSDKDIMDHTEWIMVNENTNNDIPSWLWEKMKDSLLGYKTIDGVNMPVPAENLVGRQRLGIAFRPRQTMFDNIYEARRNFIDALNVTFNTRTEEQAIVDYTSGLNENVDNPEDSPYYYVSKNDESGEKERIDEAGTMLELMSWKDPSLIGTNVLVRHDETHDNIWAIYHINRDFTYSMLDYQKWNIENYLTYNDWYKNVGITYLTPVYTAGSTTVAKNIADGLTMIPRANRYVNDGEIVKYEGDKEWRLYQNHGITSEIVGLSKTVMKLSDKIYDYVNDNINDTDTYIELYKQDDEGNLTFVKNITKYEYIHSETQKLLEILIDYVDNTEEKKKP